MKKILITGSDGHIAKQIYNYFKNEYNIIAVNHRQCNLIDYDSVQKTFKQNDYYFDYVIHTAVRGGDRLIDEDNKILLDNIEMVINLLYFNQHYGKLLTFGSGAEFDFNNRALKPYGQSKIIIRQILKNFSNCTIFRLWNVFNENQLDKRFIKTAITNYIKGQSIVINKNIYYDFFHMKDLLFYISEWLNGNQKFNKFRINCVYNTKYTLYDIANIINNFQDKKVDIIVLNNDYESDQYTSLQRGQLDLLPLRLKQTYEVLKQRFKNNE